MGGGGFGLRWLRLQQSFPKERLHELADRFRIESRPSVARSMDGVKVSRDAGVFERLIEQGTLVERNGSVLVAMHDQKGRILFADISDGIHPFDFLRVLQHSSSDQPGFGRIGLGVSLVASRRNKRVEISRPIEITNGLHAAGLLQVLSLIECFGLAAGPQQGNEVSTGRAAPGAEPFGIELILLGMSAQPTDSRLAVLDLSGLFGMPAQPVSDACDGVSFFNVSLADWQATAFVPRPPSPSVDPKDHRQRFVGLGEKQIEFLSFMPLRHIGEIPVNGHSLEWSRRVPRACRRRRPGLRLRVRFDAHGDADGCDEETREMPKGRQCSNHGFQSVQMESGTGAL